MTILLVDGGWSDWTDWEQCDVTCGEGTEVRRHECTNPAPMYRGRQCEGSRTDTRDCQTVPCPSTHKSTYLRDTFAKDPSFQLTDIGGYGANGVTAPSLVLEEPRQGTVYVTIHQLCTEDQIAMDLEHKARLATFKLAQAS